MEGIKMTNWYHRTSNRAAGAILKGGFDDGGARGGIQGIWLSDVPLNQADISCRDGMGAQVVLVVDLPMVAVREHNQMPDNEWGIVIPASVLNGFPVALHDHDLLGLNEVELHQAEQRWEQNGRPVEACRFRDARWFFETFPHLVEATRKAQEGA
jgi:hypothetical protein